MFSYRQPNLAELLPAIAWADHNKKAKLGNSKLGGRTVDLLGTEKLKVKKRVSFSVLGDEAEVTTQTESFFSGKRLHPN